MEQPIAEHIKTGINKDMVSFPGQMGALLKANSKRTIYVVLENTNGQMDESTQENGLKTKCTEKENSYGPMGESIQVSTSTTKKRDMESFIGMMVGDMKVIGKMESSMV